MADKELGYVNPMFTVPIVYYPIENWSENKKKILDALPPEDDSQKSPVMKDSKGSGSIPYGSGLYTDFFINGKVKELPSYFDTVLDVIKPYLKSFMDGNPVDFVEMWYQKYYKNVEHNTHCHGFTGWSSIIYVEFDPKVHQSTRFFSPFRQPWDCDVEVFQPKVKEGDMILFPSSLLHEAPVSRTDTRRTIISYNIRGYVDYVKHRLFSPVGTTTINNDSHTT